MYIYTIKQTQKQKIMENSNINFEANKNYKHNFIGDYELWVEYTVVRRTAKTIWIKRVNSETIKACRVDTYNGEEFVSPDGRYSMSPILNAKRLVN